jgi:N-acetylglucosamine kinase
MQTPNFLYGLDIGGTKIELVAYDLSLQEHYRRRLATPHEDFDRFVQTLATAIEACDLSLGVDPAQTRVGLALPGYTTGQGLQISSNVPSIHGGSLRQALRARLAGRVLAFGNDCQCFALSEARGGAGEGARSLFGAILGTGAGGGWCRDGRLVQGHLGLAVEWGHWPLPATLAQRWSLPLIHCGCGMQGCLEGYVSGTGLSQLYRHFSRLSSGLDGDAPIGSETQAPQIASLADAGEVVALRTLACHRDLLASALATVVLAFDPEVIVLGGGLSQVASVYQGLSERVQGHLFAGLTVPDIRPPVFGDAAATRGAALLALDAQAAGQE